MEIGDYSRKTIDAYKANAQNMSPAEAKRQAVLSAASAASDEGKASIHNAAKAARHAIESYEAKRGGLGDSRATEEAVKATASRFDDRARDLSKAQDRPRSRGMGL